MTKLFPGTLFGTDAAESLRTRGIDACAIAGRSTSGCVGATALDALCRDFIPLVVENACGDRNRRVRDANIFDLRAKYAEIATTDATITYFAAMPSS